MNLKNKINKTGAALAALMLFASCNKYINKPPLTSFVDNTYWQNETEVQLYCNGFYSEFNGAGTSITSTINSNGGTGSESDFYFASFSDDQANAGDIFPVTSAGTATTWSTPYSYIRLAELLLERIDQVPNMSDAAKNNYRGFAYFWLAEEYYDLVRHYGDVPFVNKYLDQDQDSSIIWGQRVNRDQVMDSVLNFINLAVADLYNKATADGTTGLGTNTVNQDVANALKSRICLFEGSWAKYHENNSTRATQYFQACDEACKALMNTGLYSLNADYQTVYSNQGLSTGGEVLLYRAYAIGILSNDVYEYAVATTPAPYGLTKDAVESFLCTDGQPISSSPLYKGDAAEPGAVAGTFSIANTVLANRDKRLAETVGTTLGFIGHPDSTGAISTTGYTIKRFVYAPNPVNSNVINYPIYWYPEILLNDAEALAELGNIAQSDIDNTVNKLRARAGVAPLEMANIPNDPKRDADVSPLLWEIRRERRVELMLTSFRYWDLRRWGKISYLDPSVKPDIFAGANTAGTTYTGAVTGNGYVSAPAVNRVVTIPKNYLDFIPTAQVQMYQNAGITFPQNPGW